MRVWRSASGAKARNPLSTAFGEQSLSPAPFYVKVVGAELLEGGGEERPPLWTTVSGPKRRSTM